MGKLKEGGNLGGGGYLLQRRNRFFRPFQAGFRKCDAGAERDKGERGMLRRLLLRFLLPKKAFGQRRFGRIAMRPEMADQHGDLGLAAKKQLEDEFIPRLRQFRGNRQPGAKGGLALGGYRIPDFLPALFLLRLRTNEILVLNFFFA